MIEADQPAMTTDLQTLIAYGKKLEQNEKTLGEYEIKDGNFMIVMIAKAKPAAKQNENMLPTMTPAVTLE